MQDRQVVVVTGGGSGLGRAVALKFASEGYDVALLGRSERSLAATAEEAASFGNKVVWHACDVANWTAVAAVMTSINDELGDINVLVNNAGGWVGTSIEDVDPDVLGDLFSGSVLGATYCAKAVIPSMRRIGGGSIVNIGSTSGLTGSGDSAVASTPKAAISQLTRTLGREVEKYGIRVSVVHPASIEKQRPYDEVPQANAEGRFVRLGQGQVADIVLYIVEQPANLAIRELVVMPTNVYR